MRNLKILHIATDNKFLDYALPLFCEVEGVSNSVWIISDTLTLKYTHAEVDKIVNAEKLNPREAAEFEIVILHSYRDKLADFLLQLSNKIRILWIGWGFDYYDLMPGKASSLLQPLTANFHTQYLREKSHVQRFKNYVRALSDRASQRRKEKVIQRIDYFAPVLHREYLTLKQARSDLRLPQLIDWNYGTIEDQYALNLGDDWVAGKDILVGNSATLTSNHLDALSILKTVGIAESQKIHIPLNYGDAPPEYTQLVSDRSIQMFGDHCMPITQFMALESYLQILRGCGFVIMNHIRQQALGNIITMLYLGARIFLRTDNPIYQELQECGFYLNRMDDLKPGTAWLKTPLTHQEQTNNRKLAVRRWGKDSAIVRTKTMIDKLVGH